MKAYLYHAHKYQQVAGKKQVVQIQASTHSLEPRQREILHTIPVKGVREARKVAAEYNATPGNF